LRLGIDDPEQWLESCPRRVLNVWRAYYAIEPWGNEQAVMAAVAATVKRSLIAEFGQDSVESVLQSVDNLAACHLPGEWIYRPEQKDDSIENAQAILEALHGHNN
jgi:hypothetical protein